MISKYAQKLKVRQEIALSDSGMIKLDAKISVYTKIVQDLSFELKRLQKIKELKNKT